MALVRRLDFAIVGAQKAGTSALFQFLSEHPDIHMPAAKELHFFDSEFRPWENTTYAGLHAELKGRKPWQIAGEATPIYMYWPTAPARIARYNPRMRLIVLLRHPVARAHSAWRMARAYGEEPLDFATAIREGRRRVADGSRLPGYNRQFSYVERGLYGEQIARLLGLFSRAQMLFLRTEDLRDRHRATLGQVCTFLGVAPFPTLPDARDISPISTSLADPMAQADKDLLMRLYAEDIARTAELTGLDLSHWLAGA